MRCASAFQVQNLPFRSQLQIASRDPSIMAVNRARSDCGSLHRPRKRVPDPMNAPTPRAVPERRFSPTADPQLPPMTRLRAHQSPPKSPDAFLARPLNQGVKQTRGQRQTAPKVSVMRTLRTACSFNAVGPRTAWQRGKLNGRRGRDEPTQGHQGVNIRCRSRLPDRSTIRNTRNFAPIFRVESAAYKKRTKIRSHQLWRERARERAFGPS